jgi:hypothetical protein
MWKNEATAAGFAIVDLPHFAKVLHAIDVAEKIDDVVFVMREGREDGGPDFGGLFAANGFAIFCFDEFEADGFHAVAEVQRFNVQRKGGKFQSVRRGARRETHSSVSA